MFHVEQRFPHEPPEKPFIFLRIWSFHMFSTGHDWFCTSYKDCPSRHRPLTSWYCDDNA